MRRTKREEAHTYFLHMHGRELTSWYAKWLLPQCSCAPRSSPAMLTIYNHRCNVALFDYLPTNEEFSLAIFGHAM